MRVDYLRSGGLAAATPTPELCAPQGRSTSWMCVHGVNEMRDHDLWRPECQTGTHFVRTNSYCAHRIWLLGARFAARIHSKRLTWSGVYFAGLCGPAARRGHAETETGLTRGLCGRTSCAVLLLRTCVALLVLHRSRCDFGGGLPLRRENRR